MALLTDAGRAQLIQGVVGGLINPLPVSSPRFLWLVDDAGDRLSISPGRFDVAPDPAQLIFLCTVSGTPCYVVNDDDEVIYDFTWTSATYFLTAGMEFRLNFSVN